MKVGVRKRKGVSLFLRRRKEEWKKTSQQTALPGVNSESFEIENAKQAKLTNN